ncbi:MAG: hypothetical protein ACI83O_000034 [Patescibacteria group bacterium]|jgi:hypothetical protein
MYLTKDDIQKSFPLSMSMVCDSIFHPDPDYYATNPITVSDITSRFTKDEFTDMSRLYMSQMIELPVEQWGLHPRIRMAYNWVLREYEKLD